MTREIKFRAWDKVDGMKHFNLDDLYYGRVTINHGVYDVPIMQYTELKDVEDIEMYQGDKIAFAVFDYNGADTQYEGYIKFANGQWEIWNSWDDEYYGSDGAFSLYWVCSQYDEVTVIGNIYEPELMKEEPQ